MFFSLRIDCSTGLIGERLREVFLQLDFVEVPAIKVVSLESAILPLRKSGLAKQLSPPDHDQGVHS